MVSYYQKSKNFPVVLQAALDASLANVVETLYPADVKALGIEPAMEERLVISDVQAGGNIMIGDSVRDFLTTQAKFPFTAYGIGENVEATDWKNFTAYNNAYEPSLGCYIKALPMEFEIYFVSFFNTGVDYARAMTLLTDNKAYVTRFLAPIMIAGKMYYTYCNLQLEMVKGEFAGAYEQHLTQNRIWDIAHTGVVRYTDLFLTGITPWGESGLIDEPRIYPVDDFFINIRRVEDRELIAGPYATHYKPTVQVTIPGDGEQNIAVNAPVKICFSNKMNTASVQTAFGILPVVSGDFSWESNDTVLVFTPTAPLANNTTFTVSLAETALALNGEALDEFEFTFKTVAV